MAEHPARDAGKIRTEALHLLGRALDHLAVALPEGKYGKADYDGRLRVGDFNVREVLRCPTRAAADHDPFAPTPLKMKRAVANLALRNLGAQRDLDAVSAVREALKDDTLDNWVKEGLDRLGFPKRAVVFDLAVREVEECQRVLPWSMSWTDLGRRRSWDHPERALRIATDYQAQERDRNGDVIHVLSHAERPTHETAEAAYRVVVASTERPVAEIVIHYPRTGQLPRRVGVTQEVLEEGGRVTALAVEVGLAQMRLRDRELDRHPGGHCHRCPVSDTCGPGTAWLEGPGRLRGGLPPPP